MHFKSHLREAISNILSAKLRSFLAVLGILVGTSSVVALLSGGQLATEHALQQFKKLGTDLFSVNLSSNEQNENVSSVENLEKINGIAHHFPQINYIAPYIISGGSVEVNNKNIDATILGVNDRYGQILKLSLEKGRSITALDNEEYYAVIGHDVYEDIRNTGLLEPMGSQILISGQYFTIIGVVAPATQSLFVFANVNKSIMLPILSAMDLAQQNEINNMLISVDHSDHIASMKPQFTEYLNQLFPDERIFISSPQEIIDSMKNQRQTFNLLLAFIGSIALIVGGIGVMNIMLVSVVERRKEIGIRMAVGAKRRDIQYMFLTEAVALTVLGGLLGVIFGEVIAFITAVVSGWAFYFYITPPVVGFAVCALIGVFFGFYPARAASLHDPIESLRSD